MTKRQAAHLKGGSTHSRLVTAVSQLSTADKASPALLLGDTSAVQYLVILLFPGCQRRRSVVCARCSHCHGVLAVLNRCQPFARSTLQS